MFRLQNAQASEGRTRAAIEKLKQFGKGESEVEREGLKKAAQEMESFFLYMMLKTMRKTIQKSDVFGDREKEETYIGMFDMELTKDLAKAGGMGLSPIILSELERKFQGRVGTEKGKINPQEIQAKLPVSSENEFDRLFRLPPAQRLEGGGNEASGNENNGKEKEFFWTSPISGEISSRFGYRQDPINGTERFHNGVDFAAPEGAEVRAVRPGRVVFVGEKGNFGKMVEILHPDESVTRYAHNSELLVRQGEAVVSGQVIAAVGSTGRSTGPHLHFELLQEGRKLDPMEFLLRART
jgi:murein DD-endopeptidase MepM/ murein hydrolase activator NlpD